jgi:hypothetical protein
MTRTATILLISCLAAFTPREASALITGGEGNKPIADPGWPKGAAAIFNHTGRIAWWEGPPFGGGEWHAECRGDAKALNAVLADFARIDVVTKRVVVHDGTGYSFWLAPNNEPAKRAAARIDWVFKVWQPASWERLRNLPADLNPTEANDTSPPSQIDVYAGNLPWAEVTLPQGIQVVDQRLEAHGFTPADGVVLEGHVTDLATGQPLAATVRLQRVETQKTGGYLYPDVAETRTDASGHWVMKKTPAGWVRVVMEAVGFVPRVAGFAQLDGQPRWQSYDGALSRSAPVSGRVTDDAGHPLADVDVSLGNLLPATGGRYRSAVEPAIKTDAEGRFRIEQVPAGTATVWIRKPGYCRPGLGPNITTPKDGIELQMMKSASVHVTVDFTGKERPAGYMVTMTPEGGDKVGSYGGSGDINATNQIDFKDVPPGRYTFLGRPNPGSTNDQTEPIMLDLKGGESTELTLKAK